MTSILTSLAKERADALLEAAHDLISYEDGDNPRLLTHGEVWANLRRAADNYERIKPRKST
jgi:hypothetical protein